MAASSRRTITVIVTGANRGIGRAICNGILERHHHHQIHQHIFSPTSQHATPSAQPPRLKLYATSRQGLDLDLLGEFNQHRQDTSSAQSNADVQIIYPQLDISHPDSIQEFSRRVTNEAEHAANDSGAVDVLINNAGVNLDARYYDDDEADGSQRDRGQAARDTLSVNYSGTLNMCQTFLPSLTPSGRIVNLSSVASSLKPYSESIRQRFRDPNLTLAGLEELVQEYETSVSTRTEEKSGFGVPVRSYAFSKACVNALTRILAQRILQQNHSSSPLSLSRNILINACCPGWIDTSMGALVGSQRSRPPKTPAEGARVPLNLAFGDLEGVSGRYWANESVRAKGVGVVQDW